MIKKTNKVSSAPVGQVAELFAGVGGFRLGLEASGWEVVFSNQWEPSTKLQHASNVYVANFGESGHSNIDIARLKRIPMKFDLLVGGFPCQDYSVAKTLSQSKGLRGKKGVLWWEILRLVQTHKPRFIFLENVDRLLKSPSTQRGRDFAVMLRTLGDAGYVVEWKIVNAAEFGFPQRRIRLFIVATRRTKSQRKSINPIQHITRTGILPRAFPSFTDEVNPQIVELSADLTVVSRNFNKGGRKSPFLNSGVFLDGKAFTLNLSHDECANNAFLGDILQSDEHVPNEYFVSESQLDAWRYLKGAKSISRTHKQSGLTYQYAEGSMSFPDSQNKPSRTILTGEGGPSPSRFKHIIKTSNGYRRLTPIELERLNGFPDDWTKFDCFGIQVSDVRRAFFMGNALVVGLVERVGRILAEEMGEK